jgi:HK97 family phage prohead protease
VDPNAFTDADTRDVIMQYDHTGRVFARTRNGTLTLDSDEHGLKIRADLSGTEIGRQLYEEIRGGYTDKMSFGFTVAEDVTRESEGEDGKREILRTITKIRKLYDVSAVSLPANDATEISARSLSEGVIAKAEEERLASEERMRKIEAIKAIKIGG